MIESVAIGDNPALVIKSHHNVGGLPEKMHFELVEPVRQLFKDEVRQAGLQLGLPKEIVYRQPFPGPGLAVRILGEVTPEALRILRDADTIVTSEMEAAEWYYRVWQSFAVLLPIRSVGVMGDQRTYENTIALRIVESQDGMTADWVRRALRLAGAHLDPHLQRSQRREPRRLRHLEQAAEHDRVGVSVPARTNQRGKPWKGLLASLIFSGAGQFLSGKRRRGIVWAAVLFLGPCLFLVIYNQPLFPAKCWPIAASLFLTLWVIMLFDSYRSVQPVAWWLWIGLFIASLLIGEASSRGLRSFYEAYRVPTAAMVPTLGPGDHILTQKKAYSSREPMRGDLVVFTTKGISLVPQSEGQPDVIFIKRVVGLPGDRLAIIEGRVWVNGEAMTFGDALIQSSTGTWENGCQAKERKRM